MVHAFLKHEPQVVRGLAMLVFKGQGLLIGLSGFLPAIGNLKGDSLRVPHVGIMGCQGHGLGHHAHLILTPVGEAVDLGKTQVGAVFARVKFKGLNKA